MDEYIAQLLEIIREASHNKPKPGKWFFEEDLKDIEILFSDEHPTLAHYFGIPQDYFPPAEKLEEKHIDALVPEMILLWQNFNYYPYFPEKLPNRFRYQKMREELNENHPLLKGTHEIWGIEFCNFNPRRCPFPFEYCGCKKYFLEELN